LGLLKPGTPDAFVTQDIANNWQKIDDAPGTLICTSSTRPTWNTNQTGMKIFETDTGLEWWFNGTSFQRVGPSGLLLTNAGTPAVAVQTTDVATTNDTTFVVNVAVANVVVPAGNRPLRITVNWKNCDATHGLAVCAIFRSATANTGTRLAVWQVSGDSTDPAAGGQGQGGSYTAYERTGVAPGVYAWSFQFRCSTVGGGGTATMHHDTQGGVSSISVTEE
jgi:hypothetical protein